MTRATIAHLRVSSTGVIVTGYGVSGVSWTGPGQCAITLENEVGQNEWLALVTEWAESGPSVGVMPAASLLPDDKTIVIYLQDSSNTPVTVGFTVLIDRIVSS